MAQIVFRDDVLNGETDVRRKFATILSEVEWRRIKLGEISPDELRAEGYHPDHVRELEGIATGKVEPRIREVKLDSTIEGELGGADDDPLRLNQECAALLDLAEELAPRARAADDANRKKYPPSRQVKIEKFLADMAATDPETAKELETFFYQDLDWEGRDINTCTYVYDKGENGRPHYVYDLEGSTWHAFKGFEERPVQTFESEEGMGQKQVPLSTARCGSRFLGPLDINKPGSLHRVMVVAHLATADKRDTRICRECLPHQRKVPEVKPSPDGTLRTR